ncbi:Uncharacterised protein [Mycobacteroides abscessus subsp. abscessus]|nr:Uncharacterised protein [Mycobacteroides abscessus subsp. abscessus]
MARSNRPRDFFFHPAVRARTWVAIAAVNGSSPPAVTHTVTTPRASAARWTSRSSEVFPTPRGPVSTRMRPISRPSSVIYISRSPISASCSARPTTSRATWPGVYGLGCIPKSSLDTSRCRINRYQIGPTFRILSDTSIQVSTGIGFRGLNPAKARAAFRGAKLRHIPSPSCLRSFHSPRQQVQPSGHV